MSINPNSHRPLNIDQEIIRLNSEYKVFNTIDRKQKTLKYKGYWIVALVAIVLFSSLKILPTIKLEEKTIYNADAVYKNVITLFALIFFATSAIPLGALIFKKIKDNFYKDPLIIKYAENDHTYLDFSNERNLNRLEYNDLSNLKMVINSETGKALPYDVWNVISGYINNTK